MISRILIVVLFLAAGISRLRAEDADALSRGKAALQRGDFQTAINEFKDAVKDNKKSPEPYLLLGTTYFKVDSLDQAVANLVQARDLDTSNPRIYELLGDVYLKQRLAAGAIDQFKHATLHDSANSKLWLKLGETARKNRDYNLARDAYIRVISLDSTSLTALNELGTIYVKAKLWDPALPLYLRLIKVAPDSLPIQINYVKVLFANKFYKDLAPVAQKVLDRDPNQAEIRADLSEALARTGNISAVDSLLSRMNVDSLSVQQLIDLAGAKVKIGQYDSALSLYRKALVKDSANCKVPYEMGSVMMKLKDYEGAIPMFQRKIACDTAVGYRFASNLNMAMCEMQLKQFKPAKTYAQQATQLKPDFVQAWQVLAEVNAQLEETSEEIENYKKVIALADSDETKFKSQLKEANQMIGVRYLIDATKGIKGGEGKVNKPLLQQAVKYLERALQFDPSSVQMNLWLGQSHQNLNNKEEAKKYYCRVLKMAPGGKEAETAKTGLDSMGLKCGE